MLYSTVSALRTQVEYRTAVSADDTLITSARINEFIAQTYEQLYWEIIDRIPLFNAQLGYVDFAANTENYKLSAYLLSSDGYNNMYSVWMKESSTAQYKPASPTDINLIRTSDTSLYSWSAPKYYFSGEDIWVKPSPTGTVTSGMKVYYQPGPTILSADTKTHNLPDGFDEVIIEGASSRVFRQLHDQENANIYFQQYNDLLQRYLRRLGKRNRKAKIGMRDIRYVDNITNTYGY